MPIIETESKIIYPEFKYFKSIYSAINIAEKVKIFPYNNKVNILFSQDSPYYILNGEIDSETLFLNWIKTVNCVELALSDINVLSKCLKKNVVKIEYENKNFFKFVFLDKETSTEKTIKLVNIPELNTKDLFEKYFNWNFLETYDIPDYFLNSEICTIFKKDNIITNERTNEKIIELPSARIKSIIKNSENKISIGERTAADNRIVSIISKNNELKISLRQVFNTI